MTQLLTAPTTTLEADWWEWNRQRTQLASAPDGPTALIATHWVHEQVIGTPHQFPATPGQWYRTEDSVVGIALSRTFTTTCTARLRAGESITDGTITLLAFERQGELAIRVFNRNAPNRIGFHSIAAFKPTQEWIKPAHLIPEPDTVNLTASDGTILPTPTLGWMEFEHEGSAYRLRVLGSGTKLWTAFSDKSSILGVHSFRFINIDRPGPMGDTVIDFNQAYLPPVAFSENFLCPQPTPTNTLPLLVEAGEKWVVFD